MESDLVFAMPRRELFRIHGFTRQVEPDLLTSMISEGWFATPSQVEADPDAKQVRLAVVVVRAGPVPGAPVQVLLDAQGVLAHAAPIPPEYQRLGGGLAGLKALVRSAARALVFGVEHAGSDDAQLGSIALAGYCNEDALPELRPFFVLVYRYTVAAATPAPPGFVFVSLPDLRRIALDPVSALLADAAT